MFKLEDIDECCHDNFHDFARNVYKYTDCGPWIRAVLTDGTIVYYRDKSAYTLPMDTEVDHVEVGSIVEGSDVEVGPYEVYDPKEFWKVVEEVNKEASYYWERDNTDLYLVMKKGFEPVIFRLDWGIITWETGFPHWIRGTTRNKIVRFAKDRDEINYESVDIDGWEVTLQDQGRCCY